MNKVYISMEFQATNQKLPRFWNFKRPIRNLRDFRISSDQSETSEIFEFQAINQKLQILEFQANNQKLPRFWNFKRPIRNFRDFRISSDQSETPEILEFQANNQKLQIFEFRNEKVIFNQRNKTCFFLKLFFIIILCPCYKRNISWFGVLYQVMDTLGKMGEH